MVAFADLTDLEARWRALSTAEQATATVLLEDASEDVRVACEEKGVNADTLPAARTRLVVCAMVKRAMQAAASVPAEGVTAYSSGTGPFTDSFTFANPTGDLYLTKQDRRRLGILKPKAFSIDTSIRAATP